MGANQAEQVEIDVGNLHAGNVRHLQQTLDEIGRRKSNGVDRTQMVSKQRQLGGLSQFVVVVEDHIGRVAIVGGGDGGDGVGADGSGVLGECHGITCGGGAHMHHDRDSPRRDSHAAFRDPASLVEG